MTVIVSKPAVNLREELASLRNQGGYQEQQFYFDGLVTNGTFDTDTSGWVGRNANSLLSVDSGKLSVESGAADTAYAYQQLTVTEGQRYKLLADYFDVTGVPRVYAGIGTGTNTYYDSGNLSGNGSLSTTFLATSSNLVISLFASVSATISLESQYDNISVFEVDANDDVVHRMPKGWVPKDVFEDGLLQREGSAHDYEVVYDGFDYYVKPTVAPTATTQTCVIGVKA